MKSNTIIFLVGLVAASWAGAEDQLGPSFSEGQAGKVAQPLDGRTAERTTGGRSWPGGGRRRRPSRPDPYRRDRGHPLGHLVNVFGNTLGLALGLG